MTNDNTSTESFLDEIPSKEQSGDELFKDDTEDTSQSEPSEKDTAGDSSSQSEKGKEDPSSEGDNNTADDKNVPFHKHPRFQQLIKENKELKEKVDNIVNTQGSQDTSQQTEEEEEVKEIPAWFKKLAGDDEEAKEAYKLFKQEYDKPTREKIREEVKQEQEQQSQQEQEEQRKWDEWVQSEVESLRAEGKEFDKNELMKVALDYRPEDEEGNISLEKAYDILEMKKLKEQKDNTQPKKDVASKTGSDNRGSETGTPRPSAEDIRRKDWKTLIRQNG